MSQLTVDGVAALTVAALKVELTARGLDTKGLKAALVERLTSYLVEQTTVLCRHCHTWRSSLTPRPRLSLAFLRRLLHSSLLLLNLLQHPLTLLQSRPRSVLKQTLRMRQQQSRRQALPWSNPWLRR